MMSSASRRHLLRSEKHLSGFSATSGLPSSPPRHGQHQLRQRKHASCAGNAGKDRVHQVLPMVLRSVLVSRTRPTASDATRAEDLQNIGESTSGLSPHGALGGFALATATFVASTPTSTSGVGRLGDGGRGAT